MLCAVPSHRVVPQLQCMHRLGDISGRLIQAELTCSRMHRRDHQSPSSHKHHSMDVAFTYLCERPHQHIQLCALQQGRQCRQQGPPQQVTHVDEDLWLDGGP